MKKLISTIVFFISSILVYSFQLDGISYNQQLDGEDKGYKEFYIVNRQKVRERYRINILSGSKNDISKYMEVFPKVLTVEPMDRGVLKLFANVPEGLEKKEYQFKLQFQPINIPVLAQAKEGKVVSGVSNVSIAPIVEMKGYIGKADFSKDLDIRNINIQRNSKGEGVIFTGELYNDSHAGIEFGIEFEDSNGRYLDSYYLGDVLAKTNKKSLEIPLAKIKNPKDVKKIRLYRTPSNKMEVLKEIDIKNKF